MISLAKKKLKVQKETGSDSINDHSNSRRSVEKTLAAAHNARKVNEGLIIESEQTLQKVLDRNHMKAMGRLKGSLNMLQKDVACLVLQNVSVIEQILDVEKQVKQVIQVNGIGNSGETILRPRTIAISDMMFSQRRSDRGDKCESCIEPYVNVLQLNHLTQYTNARKTSVRNQFISDSLREYILKENLLDITTSDNKNMLPKESDSDSGNGDEVVHLDDLDEMIDEQQVIDCGNEVFLQPGTAINGEKESPVKVENHAKTVTSSSSFDDGEPTNKLRNRLFVKNSSPALLIGDNSEIVGIDDSTDDKEQREHQPNPIFNKEKSTTRKYRKISFGEEISFSTDGVMPLSYTRKVSLANKTLPGEQIIKKDERVEEREFEVDAQLNVNISQKRQPDQQLTEYSEQLQKSRAVSNHVGDQTEHKLTNHTSIKHDSKPGRHKSILDYKTLEKKSKRSETLLDSGKHCQLRRNQEINNNTIKNIPDGNLSSHNLRTSRSVTNIQTRESCMDKHLIIDTACGVSTKEGIFTDSKTKTETISITKRNPEERIPVKKTAAADNSSFKIQTHKNVKANGKFAIDENEIMPEQERNATTKNTSKDIKIRSNQQNATIKKSDQNSGQRFSTRHTNAFRPTKVSTSRKDLTNLRPGISDKLRKRTETFLKAAGGNK